MTAKKQPFIESLIGQRIGGRYLVERVLGTGAMGVVAAGHYPELGQDVAIKFLRPELAVNPVLTTRFLREARLAGRVKSRHFVQVFDLGKLDSGIPFLVMERLIGHDLATELDKRGALPLADAVDYMLQALVGIAEIHALGIIHRDLKPSNLFLSEAAGTGTIKVLDFGISKDSGGPVVSALTATDALIGTPQYMSPEQVKESRTVDEGSDIWSLGVILYQLVTNVLPFVPEGGAVGELLGLILLSDPIPPKKHRPDLPDALEAVILKCLRREREERYKDVLELAEALRPFAPARAVHHLDAVRQAVATADPKRLAERAARVAADASGDSEAPPAMLDTAPADDKKEEEEAPAPPSAKEPAAADVTATTMSTTKAAVAAEPPRPRSNTVPIVIGAVVLLAVALVLLLGAK
jgi:serine/threonine-protein kinase